ncbi:hypothetical protein BD408DRAFT_150498 [Parasitella parasitica]|nr:hypothetical protein BD408DRAFT_150498 [Parasitella parasitica]
MRLSCYNCGRSGHHVRDCIQPIDYNRIKRQTDRLFKSVERDSMQPGLLSQRVKEALDMSEGDEPPYYSKMRRYGYPPGYLTHSSKTNDTEMPLLKVYDGQYVIHTKDQGKNEQTHSIRSVEYPGLYTHIIPEQSERERNPDPPTDEQMHTIQQQWNEYYHYYYLQNYQHTYYASEPLPPGVEHEANTTNTQAFLIENSINPIDLTVLGNDNDNGNDDQSVDMDISSGDEG